KGASRRLRLDTGAYPHQSGNDPLVRGDLRGARRCAGDGELWCGGGAGAWRVLRLRTLVAAAEHWCRPPACAAWPTSAAVGQARLRNDPASLRDLRTGVMRGGGARERRGGGAWRSMEERLRGRFAGLARGCTPLAPAYEDTRAVSTPRERATWRKLTTTGAL